MKRVVLYSAKNCPHCDSAKAYFKNKNINFRLCDVKTPAGQKEFNRLGYKAVPVVKVGDNIMQGFSLKQFEKLYKAKD